MNAKFIETEFFYLHYLSIFLLERGSELASIKNGLIDITQSEVDLAFKWQDILKSKLQIWVYRKLCYDSNWIAIPYLSFEYWGSKIFMSKSNS